MESIGSAARRLLAKLDERAKKAGGWPAQITESREVRGAAEKAGEASKRRNSLEPLPQPSVTEGRFSGNGNRVLIAANDDGQLFEGRGEEVTPTDADCPSPRTDDGIGSTDRAYVTLYAGKW